MTRYVQHIEQHLDKSSFPIPAERIQLRTRFGSETLIVYWVLESQYTEYKMTIDEYFRISATRKVTFSDFH